MNPPFPEQGDEVTITCKANGHPAPKITISITQGEDVIYPDKLDQNELSLSPKETEVTVWGKVKNVQTNFTVTCRAENENGEASPITAPIYVICKLNDLK